MEASCPSCISKVRRQDLEHEEMALLEFILQNLAYFDNQNKPCYQDYCFKEIHRPESASSVDLACRRIHSHLQKVSEFASKAWVGIHGNDLTVRLSFSAA